MSGDSNAKVWFEGIKAAAAFLAAAAAIVVPTCVTNSFNRAIQEREIQAKYVELAISILRERPYPEAEPLRKWAISIVSAYTDKPLPLETQSVLLKNPILSWSDMDFEHWKATDPRVKEIGVERALRERRAEIENRPKQLRDLADQLERLQRDLNKQR